MGGVIKSKRGVLKECKLTDINNQMYTSLHEENNLERDVIDEFYDWKRNHNDLVLYVKGPRQVGKTTEIMKFAYKFYDQVIYINLASEDDLRLFEEIMSTGHMKFGLIRYCRMSNNFEYNNSKNTVLIIDEIQESSRIYNKIRIFQKELRCDVIVTGSYLGATLNNKFLYQWVTYMI